MNLIHELTQLTIDVNKYYMCVVKVHYMDMLTLFFSLFICFMKLNVSSQYMLFLFFMFAFVQVIRNLLYLIRYIMFTNNGYICGYFYSQSNSEYKKNRNTLLLKCVINLIQLFIFIFLFKRINDNKLGIIEFSYDLLLGKDNNKKYNVEGH